MMGNITLCETAFIEATTLCRTGLKNKLKYQIESRFSVFVKVPRINSRGDRGTTAMAWLLNYAKVNVNYQPTADNVFLPERE